jgi:hypothetical protein
MKEIAYSVAEYRALGLAGDGKIRLGFFLAVL